MSAVTAVSQRYTISGSGVRKWCDGGRERCRRLTELKYLYKFCSVYDACEFLILLKKIANNCKTR